MGRDFVVVRQLLTEQRHLLVQILEVLRDDRWSVVAEVGAASATPTSEHGATSKATLGIASRPASDGGAK